MILVVHTAGCLYAGALKGRPSAGGLAGWEGADRLGASDYQQKVKEENRRAAAAAGAAGLLAGSGGALGAAAAAGGGAAAAGARPTSGNKKFLDKYQLAQYNLFAP